MPNASTDSLHYEPSKADGCVLGQFALAFEIGSLFCTQSLKVADGSYQAERYSSFSQTANKDFWPTLRPGMSEIID